jgi:aspartate aminotransferase-like enzyme
MQISQLPDGLSEAPRPKIRMTAGPSKQHELYGAAQEWVREMAQESHRGGAVKSLIAVEHGAIFRTMGTSPDQGSVLIDTPGGTYGLNRAAQAVLHPEIPGPVVLVNTDNFSGVFGGEINAVMGRTDEVIPFERGEALTIGSPEFEELAGRVERGEIAVLALTENGTTTGTNQRIAIEELIRRRDVAGSPTIILVDAVSAQVIGVERQYLPDALVMSGQKDPATGAGFGHVMFSENAVQRSEELNSRGLYRGKLHPWAEIQRGNEQTETTPPLRELARSAIVWNHLRGAGSTRWQDVAQEQEAAYKHLARLLDHGRLGELGMSFRTTNPDLRSRSAHVLTLPSAVEPSAVVQRMGERGIAIAKGYGLWGKPAKKRGEEPGEVRLCTYSANTSSEMNEVGEVLGDVVRGLLG